MRTGPAAGWAALLGIMYVAGGGPLLAATGQIEEVVVTAQKRESTLQETPIAVTALSVSEIEERQIAGISQIQHVAPNLVFNSLGGTTNLYVRGIGTDINDSLAEPGVALYVDGVYQGVTGDQAALYNDLQRIEVLRGPQGTLYGRNSTGGNVHIFSRDPDFAPGFEASLLVGEYDRTRAAASVQGALVQDRVAARASVVADRRDGVRKNPFDGEDVEELDLASGRLAVLFRPAETVEFTLRGDWTRRKDDTPRWDYVEVVPGSGLNPFMFGGVSAPGSDRIVNNGRTKYETDIWGVSGTLTWELGSVTLKSITAYRESDWGGEYDNDGTDIDFLQARPTQTSEQFSQEIDLVGTALGDRLDWIAGLYYFQQDSMAEYTYVLPVIQSSLEGAFGLPPGGLGDPALNPVFAERLSGGGAVFPFNDFNTLQDTESRAVFAEATYHLTPSARLTAGARYTSDKKEVVQNAATNISPQGCSDLEQDEKWNETTWKVGADLDVTDEAMVYASVSKGFHAGGFNGGSCGDEYDPETLLAYEIGLKSQLADGRVRLNVAGFYYDYDDYQARLFVGQRALVENAAKATVKGLEAEFLLQPIAGLQIDGSVSWLDGEFGEFSADNPMTPAVELVDLKGNRLLRSPEYSFNVGVQYTFGLADRGNLTARWEAAHKDDYFVSVFNDDFSQIDSYTTQNARLIWNDASGRWQVQAFVENLTDEDYFEAIVLTPSVGGSLGIYTLPRVWGLQLRYSAY
ncbi:MAG: TonB-dependent receptor [Pseudomonadales bacterium]